MTFPDGSVKEGKFENNVFIQPPTEISQTVSPIPITKKMP